MKKPDRILDAIARGRERRAFDALTTSGSWNNMLTPPSPPLAWHARARRRMRSLYFEAKHRARHAWLALIGRDDACGGDY